jgi:hypothetical protein
MPASLSNTWNLQTHPAIYLMTHDLTSSLYLSSRGADVYPGRRQVQYASIVGPVSGLWHTCKKQKQTVVDLPPTTDHV